MVIVHPGLLDSTGLHLLSLCKVTDGTIILNSAISYYPQ